MIAKIEENLVQAEDLTPAQQEQYDLVVDMFARNPNSTLLNHINIDFPILDGPLPNMDDMGDVADLIFKQWKRGKKVAINCQAGLNRSGLMMSLVLYRNGLRGQEIFDKILAVQPAALINPVFAKYVADELK